MGTAELAAGAFWTALGDFPATRYLRIFSNRLGPMPRIASKSSTLLDGPYDLRICRIFPAVAGPIPGTYGSCSELAELMLIGWAGGFFDVACRVATNRNVRHHQ